MATFMTRFRNSRRWMFGEPVKANRLNGDASRHQQVPIAHQLTRRQQLVRTRTRRT